MREGHFDDHFRSEVRHFEAAEAMVVVEVGNEVAHEVKLALGILSLDKGRAQLILLLLLSGIPTYLLFSELKSEDVDVAGVAAD